jgi:hypothetical protein
MSECHCGKDGHPLGSINCPVHGTAGNYVFERVSADRLARAIIGDVRVAPSASQLSAAQRIIDHTGSLYRLRA